MINITSASKRFCSVGFTNFPYRRASFVKVDAIDAPMKKSPSIKYCRSGGRFSFLLFLKKKRFVRFWEFSVVHISCSAEDF